MTIDLSGSIQRVPFSKDLESLRSLLIQLLPILESEPGWYGSIYFERKASKTFTAHLKQTQIANSVSTGVVFRIYDGATLFEEATDELDFAALKHCAIRFSKRVQSYPVAEERLEQPTRSESSFSQKVFYRPDAWADKLASPLEEEITSQLPKNLDAHVSVHFGIRYILDPKKQAPSDYLSYLKKIIERCKELAPEQGLKASDLTYLLARQSFHEEESIFVDRETNLSQALYRMTLSVTAMSGSNRTFLRIGGLGGLETIHLEDPDLVLLLKDLKSLKSSERLQPGQYRILFGPALSGVLAHEAFGHSQEGDTCARGRSKAWDLYKTGEVVGNQNATILNNPAIFENATQSYGAWGSYFFDEEGWLAREQVLLDQGKLLAPMTHLTSAIRLGIPRTANGKRESWAHGVYTRQTNTYFSPGDKTFAQLMEDLGDGFLALHPAGGMEDPKGMGIQVGISYLHEVKEGKLTGRVFRGPAGGDIQMTGYTPDVLNSIVAKSKIEANTNSPDQARFPFNDVGGCGKYHKEFVFAGCGGPFMLLNQIILG